MRIQAKLTLLFLLLYAFGYSQQAGTLLKPSAINGYTVNGKVLMTATDGAITGVPTWTNSIPFSMITGTSSILFSTSTYSNPSWLSSLAWSKITGTPTTLSGYGITDGVLNTSSITINGSSQLLSGSSFSVGNLNGSPTANYILKGVSSSSVTNSRILDNGTSIGINQTPIDAAQLEITGGALQGAYIQTSGSIGVNIVDNTGIANKSETSTGIGFRANVTNTSGVGLDIEYTPLSEKWIVVNNNGTSTKALNLPNQTASRVAVFDGSKYVTSSSVTTTELGLLSGVTGSLVTTTGTQTLTNKYIDGGTASTPTVGSNDNSVATTSFVTSALASHSSTITTTIAQQTTTLATATAVTTLSTSVSASSTYIVRGHLRITCNNTGGVKLGVNFPTGSTCSVEAAGRLSSTTTMANNLLVSSGTLASQAYNTVNSTSGNVMIDGFIVTGANAGTFEFIFASTNAGETSSILNGYIEFIKVN